MWICGWTVAIFVWHDTNTHTHSARIGVVSHFVVLIMNFYEWLKWKENRNKHHRYCSFAVAPSIRWLHGNPILMRPSAITPVCIHALGRKSIWPSTASNWYAVRCRRSYPTTTRIVRCPVLCSFGLCRMSVIKSVTLRSRSPSKMAPVPRSKIAKVSMQCIQFTWHTSCLYERSRWSNELKQTFLIFVKNKNRQPDDVAVQWGHGQGSYYSTNNHRHGLHVQHFV